VKDGKGGKKSRAKRSETRSPGNHKKKKGKTLFGGVEIGWENRALRIQGLNEISYKNGTGTEIEKSEGGRLL